MTPLQDFIYRFTGDHQHMAGRCRVRIYRRTPRTHTVLLTELNFNSGEPVAEASARIATDLAARWKLNPRTTRWVQHDGSRETVPPRFDEVQFTWDGNRVASRPQWQSMSGVQAEALTGDSVTNLNRGIGDSGFQMEGSGR